MDEIIQKGEMDQAKVILCWFSLILSAFAVGKMRWIFCCQLWCCVSCIGHWWYFTWFVLKIAEEIDVLQEKLNVKTEKLNVMKSRRDELSRKLDETETHLKQVSWYFNGLFGWILIINFDEYSSLFCFSISFILLLFLILLSAAGHIRCCAKLHQARVEFKCEEIRDFMNVPINRTDASVR